MSTDNGAGGKLAQMTAGGQLTAILPRNFEEVWRFAQLAVKSGLFKGEQKKAAKDAEDGAEIPDWREAAHAQATMIILQGLELDVPPLQALQGISIINGRTLIWGSLLPAILRSKGCKIKEHQTGAPYEDDYTAHCEIERPDGEVIAYSYSVADAKRAKLWSPDPVIKRWKWGKERGKKEYYEVENDSPWHTDPKRMLIHRCRGFCANDGASDYLRGLYPREIMEDALRSREMRDVTPQIDTAPGGQVAPVAVKASVSSDDLSFIPTASTAPATPTTAPTKPNGAPKPEVKPEPKPTPAKADVAPADRGEEVLADLGVAMAACATEEEFNAVWRDRIEITCQLGMKDKQKAEAIYKQHEHRLGIEP